MISTVKHRHHPEMWEDDENGTLLDRPSQPKRIHYLTKTRLLILALFCIAAVAVFSGYEIGRIKRHDPSSSSKYDSAGVATDNEICSEMGVDILKAGGNVVDAAVTSLLCIGVVNSHSAGIGGGGFMVLSVNGTKETIDFRETAPANASKDMYEKFTNCTEPSTPGGQGDLQQCPSRLGGLAVGVPGELRGLELAHSRHGRMAWIDLVMPVVELCRKGFPISGANANAIRDTLKFILQDSYLFRVFTVNGVPKTAGTILKRPLLADTLEKVARHGASVLYEGEIAEAIIDTIHNNPFQKGMMTVADLKNYKAVVRPVLEGSYLGNKLYSMGAPGSGGVLFAAFNILEKYNMNCQDKRAWDDIDYHRMIEALKFAYAERYRIGDPCCDETGDPNVCNNQTLCQNVTDAMAEMTSPKYATESHARILDNETHHDASWYEQSENTHEQKPTPGTTHISILASNNDAIAITSTVNLHFGSKLMTRHGIVLNNEMDDFSSPNITNAFGYSPSESNFIEPGKRPLSSSTPLIVEDKYGDVRLATGASGGSMIITAVLQVALRILSQCKTPEEAVNMARLHHQLLPMNVFGEREFDTKIRSELENIGHWWNETSAVGVCQTVSRYVTDDKPASSGYIMAASDSLRKPGAKAAGY